MNKILLLKYLLPIILLCSTKVLAKQTLASCESKSKGTAELSHCLDEVKSLKERELQTWINNQIFVLEELAAKTGRQASLSIFKTSQRYFVSFRENNCRWQFLAIAPDPNAPVAFKKCYITLTNDRINELASINR